MGQTNYTSLTHPFLLIGPHNRPRQRHHPLPTLLPQRTSRHCAQIPPRTRRFRPTPRPPDPGLGTPRRQRRIASPKGCIRVFETRCRRVSSGSRSEESEYGGQWGEGVVGGCVLGGG